MATPESGWPVELSCKDTRDMDLKMSLRPSSREFTYGWHRAEIIGTMMSVVFLLTVTVWLLVEATNRIVT